MTKEEIILVAAAEREECAKMLELKAADVLLMAGELKRGELQAVMSVISCLRNRMRSRGLTGD